MKISDLATIYYYQYPHHPTDNPKRRVESTRECKCSETGVLSPRTTYHSHLEARSICQDFLGLVVTLGNPLPLHAYEYNESDDRQIQLATCCTPREVIGSFNQPKAVFGFGDHPDDSNLVSLRLASRNAQYAQSCPRSVRPETAIASASTFHCRLPNARFISTYRRRNVCVVRPEVFLPRADRRSLPVKVPGYRKARIWLVFHGVALQRPCVSHKEIASSLWLMIENMQASIAMW